MKKVNLLSFLKLLLAAKESVRAMKDESTNVWIILKEYIETASWNGDINMTTSYRYDKHETLLPHVVAQAEMDRWYWQ